MRLLTVALVLAVATSSAAPTTRIGTRGAVVGISADGERVAIHASVGSDPECHSGAVWRPSSGTVVRLNAAPCGRNASDLQYDGLALAGGRVAWNDYDFGNHAYCYGPFTSSLDAPKRVVDLGVCAGEEGESDQLWDFAGDGDLLIARSYTRCEADCEPDFTRSYDDDVVLWRIGVKITRLVREKDDAKLLDVEDGRILVHRPDGVLVVYSPTGKTVATISAGPAGGALDGERVVARRGTHLLVYDLTGELVVRRVMRTSGRLQDAEDGVAVYVLGGEVRGLRLSDGRDRSLVRAKNLVAADLEPGGLFYAYNAPGGGTKPGRVAHVPLAVVRGRFR